MFVKNEQITPDGLTDEFTLANKFQPGTILIDYDGFVFYQYYEETDNEKLKFDFVPPVGAKIFVSYYTEGQPYSLNAIRYATPKQIISRSRIADLQTTTEDEIEKLIRNAELAIDTYIGNYCQLYSTLNTDYKLKGQKLKFPRAIDDLDNLENDNLLEYVGILQEITDACLYVVENIFLQGEPDLDQEKDSQIISESLGDYSYNKNKASSYKVFAYNAILGTKAKLILDKFRNNSSRAGQLMIRGDHANGLLNSRQRFMLDNY